MAATVLYMSVSLDGFIAGPNVRPDNALGDGGERLHDWVFQGDTDGGHQGAGARLSGVNRQVFDELMATGAVIAGRPTFDPPHGWGGDHHGGVPIYIVSRHPAPEWAVGWPNVHFVSDLEIAVRDAKAAAAEKNVMLHGASLARWALDAGVLDELELHLVPVLLSDGIRLFDGLAVGPRELERTRVLVGEGGVTHLHYRVIR